MDLAEELQAELEIPTAFTIPIGNGIAINQTVVITWGIIAFLFVLMLILTIFLIQEHLLFLIKKVLKLV